MNKLLLNLIFVAIFFCLTSQPAYAIPDDRSGVITPQQAESISNPEPEHIPQVKLEMPEELTIGNIPDVPALPTIPRSPAITVDTVNNELFYRDNNGTNFIQGANDGSDRVNYPDGSSIWEYPQEGKRGWIDNPSRRGYIQIKQNDNTGEKEFSQRGANGDGINVTTYNDVPTGVITNSKGEVLDKLDDGTYVPVSDYLPSELRPQKRPEGTMR